MTNNKTDLPEFVKKYKSKFASDKWKLAIDCSKKYKLIVVIPVLSESGNLPKLVKSLNENESQYFSEILVLFVINSVVDCSHKIIDDNQKSIDFLESIISQGKLKFDLSYVDCNSKENQLTEKEGGVGLARKIGMDLALEYFDYSKNNKNILFCLDADCTVSKNYFDEVINNFNKNNYSAAYVKYEHPLVGEEKNIKAIVCYEIFLRHYLLGLKTACSPYGFHTIGSTMACNAESYVKIGGMNKRKAAEDFYFMEKLSKVTRINEINTACVYPSGRGSWRVPFGTGQRVNRFLSKKQNEYLLYSLDSFLLLKKWLDVFNNDEIFSAEDYVKQIEELHPGLKKFFNEIKFERDWNKIISKLKPKEIIKQKRYWFDGFKTLKFVHFIRDNIYPLENMFTGLDRIFEFLQMKNPPCNKSTQIPDLDIQIKYLQKLRELT
ncbi:MAG: hypothetical protein PVH88_09780 [Ignavibacteria bacterium]|jgi:hypothetical protein